MVTTLIASLLLTQGALVCPMTGEEISKSAADIDYNGVRYSMCCGGCPDAFKKDPAKALANKSLEGKLVGIALFDPVSGARVEEKNAKGGSEDYKGIRYFFQTAEDKSAFDADPKKFSAAPKKELLFCAVMGHELKDEATAGGYVDFEETRYYVCCADCLAALKKDTKALVAKVQAKAVTPVAMNAPKKSN
jgi:YHS domain-containing protein